MTFRKSVMGALSLVVATFAMLLSLSAPASAAPGDCEAGYPPSQSTVAVSSNVVAAGGELSFSASCFAAGETVTAEIRSTPVQVGTFEADAEGDVSGTVTVPSSMDPGRHTLVLTGQQSGITQSVEFTVAAAPAAGGLGHKPSSPSSLAFTGAQVGGMVGGGLVLIVGGALLLMVARRRRTPLGA